MDNDLLVQSPLLNKYVVAEEKKGQSWESV